MQESDFSKSVAATPFEAANGDANGDLSVNVLDIISIIDYMLENNPTRLAEMGYKDKTVSNLMDALVKSRSIVVEDWRFLAA